MNIEVKVIAPRRHLDFIKFAWQVQGSNPNWVPPLIMERKEFLNPKKNPFFQHGEVELYMAYVDSKPVGRIAAIVNQNHIRFHHENVGFFGLFECIDDLEVAQALFDRAARFLRSKGMEIMRGPASLSSNDEWGLLIEGFRSPPQIMMPYNPPYYQALLESSGFSKAADLLAYSLDQQVGMTERISRAAEFVLKRNSIEIRTVNMKRFDDEVAIMKDLYNQAWESNWGFVPMTDQEFDHLAKQLKQVIDPDLVFIGYCKGRPIGFSVMIPNLNEALIKLRSGRLFPTGLPRLLWNARKGKIKSLRVLTLGVVKEFRNTGLDVVFYHRSLVTGGRKGYTWGELSWILEDNLKIRRPLEKLGAVVYKKYRIYDFDLKVNGG